jgi:D-tyrosyl-tRNA(Tyr) deacylase
MKLILQRTSRASVSVDGKIVGQIDQGLMVLIGITHTDTKENADALIKKLVNLRVFNDEHGKMNLSIQDVKGEFLVISQFTLYGNAKKGNRPSYVDAAPPDVAIPLYEYFVDTLMLESQLKVETGIFGAMMDVELVNSGPVTLILESYQ